MRRFGFIVHRIPAILRRFSWPKDFLVTVGEDVRGALLKKKKTVATRSHTDPVATSRHLTRMGQFRLDD